MPLTYRIPNAKLRSRDGYTQNRGNVWGHCEEEGQEYACTNQTLYRCDTCKQFVCSDHQRKHTKDHQK